ncbi:MAG TPA: LysM peptidoglycan-binding domain-containing protein [Bryobacteraceae bacterium]|nr:LysM peptidoglycan-binding domain-containing protein [Bryobacteraceae bacterium]
MSLDAKWTRTVDDGKTNAAWDTYDSTIMKEVNDYNSKFKSTPGFKAADWTLFKALLWVESGGPGNPSWTKRVMQIGNPHDPGYKVLKGGTEGSSLVMSTQLASDIKRNSIDDPQLNIRAGIAYVYTRMAKFDTKSVDDPKDASDHSYTVLPGDSLEKIAAKVGTTVEVLGKMNPAAKRMIHPKQVLKFRKASMQRVIVGWRDFSTANLQTLYNGNRDPDYAAKLQYVLELFGHLTRPASTQTTPP